MQCNCSEPEWVKHLSYFTVTGASQQQFHNLNWKVECLYTERTGEVRVSCMLYQCQ